MAFVAALLVVGQQPWDKYNYSPKGTRTLLPVRPPSLPVVLDGAGDSVVFDFGKEVGGFTSVDFGSVTASSGAARGPSAMLTWSESTYYIVSGDNSNGGPGDDGPLSTGPLSTGSRWNASVAHLRGGFRYFRVALDDAGGRVTIDRVRLHFSAAPTMGDDPSAYAGHFLSSDELLNRVWYGCAYTVQLCSIDPSHGRVWPAPSAGWNNSATCGLGRSVLVDGAKRDRIVWPGDMGMSMATAFATTGDTYSARVR